jgi:hypothetical protein
MDLTENAKIIYEYLLSPKSKRTMRLLNEWFPNFNDYQIIFNISQNERLWYKFSEGSGKNFRTLTAAFENATPDSIVLYFAELGLYKIYDQLERYHALCDTLRDGFEDENRLKVSMHQLVLEDRRQRLVFVTNDNDSVGNLKKYVKDCFKSDSTVVQNKGRYEITVNDVLANNRQESQDMYEKLYSRVQDQQPDLVNNMYPMQYATNSGYKYIQPLATDAILATTLDELKKVLKCGPINGTVNIMIGNNNNIIINKAKDTRKTDTDEWIKNNLPEYREVTTDYYNRYQTAVKNALPVNQFSQQVRKANYDIKQGHGFRFWSKMD